MSGGDRRFGGWLLPVIVVLAGLGLLIAGKTAGTLKPASLKPVGWAGIVLMIGGAIAALFGGKRAMMRLIGVIACGIGAILVICL